MNYGIVRRVLGSILVIESLLMTPSLLIAIRTGGIDKIPFLITIALTAAIGLFLRRSNRGDGKIAAKEGLFIVAVGWLVISILGAIPLYLAESTPTYIDAFFEIVSGFTTTGATVIEDVEALPLGILFWRSLTHWIGGMGILVFTLALLPTLGIGGFQILKAESPGPVTSKIAPKIKDTAKILYITYISLTLLEVIFLKLGGMSLFESFTYTFATVGTGGFATKNASVGWYDNTYIYVVIGIFMLLSGVNFSIYYEIFRGRWRDAIKNEELRLYLSIIGLAIFAITLNLYFSQIHGVLESLKQSFFQVISIITTTGFSTTDFDLWPSFSKLILFLLMFTGASAGSTGGGMKIIRILVVFKLIKRNILKIFHPRAMIPIKINKKIIASETVDSINSFLALYIMLFVVSTILISLEGVDMVSAASSVAATLGNIGPGFNFVGPSQTFFGYSLIGKLYLSLLMLLGRLELFTIIALLVPKNWRREV